MTGCTDAELHLSVGAYVLGTLEPADEAAVEAHLAGCPACLAEASRLAPLVAPLSSLTRDDLESPRPSPQVFDRISAAVAESAPAAPTRRPRRWLLAVAASIVLLAGGAVAADVAFSGSGTSTTRSVTANGIHLAVDARPTATGTRLALTVSGLPAHERCHLVALAADGTMHDAGTWNADYDGSARLVESTDVSRSQLRGLTLFADGKRLADLDM